MSLLARFPHISPRLRTALACIGFALAVVLIFPYKTTIVPAWTLRVVDESGIPVPAVNVTQHWQHYLLESEGHDEVRRVGTDGQVSFPERTIRASLVRKIQARLNRVDKTGVEARSEPYASVVVWGSKLHETAVAVYHEEQGPQAEIVVHSTP
jgi:hypothetical protein